MLRLNVNMTKRKHPAIIGDDAGTATAKGHKVGFQSGLNAINQLLNFWVAAAINTGVCISPAKQAVVGTLIWRHKDFVVAKQSSGYSPLSVMPLIMLMTMHNMYTS